MGKVTIADCGLRIADWLRPFDRLAIVGLALLFFLPWLGGCHLFDWDEINFAECAREMLLTGDWSRPQVNFEPFWEKPPLFIWAQACSMSVFGAHEFAARLPNAVCGAATLLIIYGVGRRAVSRRFGWLWAGAWLASLLPHLYFRSGIIDPWFNLLIFSGLWLYFEKKPALGGGLIGLAVLTKGPVALLIFLLVAAAELLLDFFSSEGRPPLARRLGAILMATLACLAVASSWFFYEFWENGPWFVERFVAYQIKLFTTPDAGHGGFIGFHVVVLLVGCFPASVFAVRQFFEKSGEARWLKTLFWVVLVLFSITSTKIVHYSSLCYFPLTFLAARTLDGLLAGRSRLFFLEKIGLWLIGGLLGLAAAALPFLMKNPVLLESFVKKDPFAAAAISAETGWTGWESIAGPLFLAGLATGFLFFKKGKRRLAVAAWLGGGAVFTALGILFFVKKIEGHSQRAAIEFYQSKAVEDCEIRTHRFFSYAQHFYSNQRPRAAGRAPAHQYLVAKIPRLDGLAGNPEFTELYRKNGFVFFERVRPTGGKKAAE